MGVMLCCIDPMGSRIVLTDDTWYGHILPGHGIMDGYDSCVEKAITDPHRIMDDRAYTGRINYYRHKTHPKHPKMYVKVCVEFRASDRDGVVRGKVVTAFLTGRFEEGEEQIWPPQQKPSTRST